MGKLTSASLNPNLVKAQYAVRGELVIKAEAYKAQLKNQGAGANLPFSKVVACNIGNPHQLDQKPLTFFRQVLALMHYPELLSNSAVQNMFSEDAIARAKVYLSEFKGTGAYTHSKGLSRVRQEVAEFIQERDGLRELPNTEHIFLTDGASSGVKMLLSAMITNEKDAVLCPIPQYPLYSATMALLNAQLVGYYLDEANGWMMNVDLLEKTIKEARDKGLNVRSIVVINPGNPTGQVLAYDNMVQLIKFCHRENLVLCADEVYQTNIYEKTPFTSFRQVLSEMDDKAVRTGVQLVSFHSVSKGFLGECGQRGGYFELVNFEEDVVEQLYKLASISLCSNVTGQLMVGLMCRPPKKGDASHDQYEQEKADILSSLQRRAKMLTAALNKLEGVTCNPVEGALYAFPRVTLPQKAVEEAAKLGKTADTMYALGLLDATGICVVPGSGFGQLPNTYHFRTTILPQEKDMDNVVDMMSRFHSAYMNKYK